MRSAASRTSFPHATMSTADLCLLDISRLSPASFLCASPTGPSVLDSLDICLGDHSQYICSPSSTTNTKLPRPRPRVDAGPRRWREDFGHWLEVAVAEIVAREQTK